MKRAGIIGIAAGAAVLVAAGAVAWWWLARPPGPADVAGDYLRALQSGDAGAALERVAVDDAAARDAGSAYAAVLALPDDVAVGAVTESGDTARVDVTYTLSGEDVAATLSLARDGGVWRLTDALGTVTATTTLGETLRVGALDVPGGDEVRLLPGVYRVEPLPAGVLDGAVEAVVAPGGAAEADVEASFAPGAIAIVQEQLDAYAEACAQPATAVPPNCGLRVPWGADLRALSALTFRIEELPQVTISADAAGFAATGGVIVATATGEPRSGGASSFTYRADDWALYGSLDFDGPTLVVAVR